MTQRNGILLGVGVAVLLGAAVLAKLWLFPSIKEEYFATTNRTLERVPAGLVTVRPTQFGKSARKGVFSAPLRKGGKTIWRLCGRDVTFKALIAAAYGQNESRVELPWDAPKLNYDFLVTTADKPQAHLQTAIRKQLGYTADWAARDSEVMALRVENADLPGLSVSGAGESPNVNFREGRLYFTHMQMSMLTGGLEQVVKQPVVDQTGLTNFYNFSLAWNVQMERDLDNRTNGPAVAGKLIGVWGLALKPDTASVRTLVVKKVK